MSWSDIDPEYNMEECWKAFAELNKRNLLDKSKIREIDEKELALAIKSSGYNNQKAKKIKKFIEFLDSKKEINRTNLLSVWGIGKETADSMLCMLIKASLCNRCLYKKDNVKDLQKRFWLWWTARAVHEEFGKWL